MNACANLALIAALVSPLISADPIQEGAPSPFPAPKSAEIGLDEAIAGALAWLVANQNPDGSWGSHHSPRPIEVLSSVPGSQEAFRVATTALCALAMADAAGGPLPGTATGADLSSCVDRAIDYLLEKNGRVPCPRLTTRPPA